MWIFLVADELVVGDLHQLGFCDLADANCPVTNFLSVGIAILIGIELF